VRPVAGPRFLVARLPAEGSFLLDRSRGTGLRADLMQESRKENGDRVEIASLLVLRGVDSGEREVVLRELAARYRHVEEVPANLPATGATLHRLTIGSKVVEARGLGALAGLMQEFGATWSRISAGAYELWAPLPADSDGEATAARLQAHFRDAGVDVQTRIALPSLEDYEVFRILTDRVKAAGAASSAPAGALRNPD